MTAAVQVSIVRARLDIVHCASKAAELDGLSPVERAQMLTIAALAALQLHRVEGEPDDADCRAASNDVEAITRPVLKLFSTIFEAAHGLVDADAIEA
jgi:hypothetical protein